MSRSFRHLPHPARQTGGRGTALHGRPPGGTETHWLCGPGTQHREGCDVSRASVHDERRTPQLRPASTRVGRGGAGSYSRPDRGGVSSTKWKRCREVGIRVPRRAPRSFPGQASAHLRADRGPSPSNRRSLTTVLTTGSRGSLRRSEPKSLKRLAPQAGLEPATLRLTAGCSAIELLRNTGKRKPQLHARAGASGTIGGCCPKPQS